MKNIPEKYTKKFSKDEINSLPLRRYTGPVTLVRTEDELEAALRALHSEELIGFDTETRPTFRKGKMNLPSLIQFAARDMVYLIHLGWVAFSEGIQDVLSSPHIVKTGVAVRDDIKDLKKLACFEDAAVVDLGEVARELGMETHGLRNLAANLLEFRISKAAQCSNWSNLELSRQQISYAATDAWVSREIHLRMRELGLVSF
ncbi:3'-5' exonuclease [Oleidesulfovibrio alaskensis G20]|jgi:ribonuclease D|uniref:3'-5' exonuclease n=1 Tax=Oleidesulfovibrio alaskensis (strain ATCC BAA-1058 / DSM 17464 / G20) TaxID=207559 RepID=Q30YR1_OLEA2|nr:3'-5' exonuclease [Oleidesulfovibrio alaskensis]ABB39185.1 3'-5' exonuclease [Oleidesulfovibrio alaskensis G20]MBG0772056.1 3'-5' exonuclease domain-containing protein 2 [Oleidesulfovibrio alaskensis]MBL3581706.1 3'-5' exonuclease domain-containing protein 2 [Oleidesulfovibrio alaskensis]